MPKFTKPVTVPDSVSLNGQVTDLTLLSSTRIDHELDVFDARRGVLQLVVSAGLSKKQAHYLITAMTELGNNIVVHSHGGQLSLYALYTVSQQHLSDASSRRTLLGVCLVAEDEGPGIVDIERALAEGYSSINSMGCGLSGVERLMDELNITSCPEGTRIQAWMWQQQNNGLDYV